MKKIFLIALTFSFIIFLPKNTSAYGGCLNYGVMAYESGGYCKCLFGYVMGSFLGQPYCISIDQSCKDQYGYGATSDYLTNKCKCRLGYTWDTSYSGTKCVSCSTKYGSGSTGATDGGCECESGYSLQKDSYGEVKCVDNNVICQDDYGTKAKYNFLSDKCECKSGYIFWEDAFGKIQCVDDDTFCRNNYGFRAEYNSLADKCECGYGYEFTLKTSGGLECESCSSKYGYYSSYNALENKCECMNDYTLDDDNQCVKKQNNVYFKLIELDSDNNKALIKSEHDNKYYSVEYRTGCYSPSFRRYLNKQIVVNLGTDFFVDKGDKIVLQDDNEVCEIKDFEKVDSDFSFIEDKNESIVVNTSINFNNKNSVDNTLSNKLKGRILLQVESRGEAYYVNPKDGKRYYMANGNEAYRIMRYLSVGITNVDLNRIQTNKDFAKQHKGKIFLQVESKGEAYYIDFDGVPHYLKDGQVAYEAMRNLGLGITNENLNKIIEGDY
ncbi:MAG: hypothetical protein PHQ01_02310 [Candidatus Pacebacteria bacterium]|nr:hypothetical protein [Bacteroidales bacterium]MDD3940384.1 hypothetical protein [Candidatus Paceibacterota bacterium]